MIPINFGVRSLGKIGSIGIAVYTVHCLTALPILGHSSEHHHAKTTARGTTTKVTSSSEQNKYLQHQGMTHKTMNAITIPSASVPGETFPNAEAKVITTLSQVPPGLGESLLGLLFLTPLGLHTYKRFLP